MTKITKQELLKISQISQLRLDEHEIEPLIEQIQGVLTYAERVQEVAEDVEIPSNKNVNVVREDMIVRTNSEQILKQAPEHEENFFVVPKIIENK